MESNFRSFVMLAEMRTGSNYLESQLNSFDGVTCWGEAFNPHFICNKNVFDKLGVSLEERIKDPLFFLKKIRENTAGISGFRFFHDHDAKIRDEILDDASCAKIILTRNPLESYISWKIASETGQWKLSNLNHARSTKVIFNIDEFESYFKRIEDFQALVQYRLQVTGQTAFYVDYQDIVDLDVINGLARFLGVSQQLEVLNTQLKRQNPESLLDKVSNPQKMIDFLSASDRFGYSKTPNLEPKRGAGIPRLIVSLDLPLLFLPLANGFDSQVSAWISELGSQGPTSSLNQKTLKEWRKANPNHRSFTVLRHPVVRSYQAFVNLILDKRLRDQRDHFMRIMKCDLPSDVSDFETKSQLQKTFMTFLRYLKFGISGQLDTKLPADFASQFSILQGASFAVVPDVILREDTLASGLNFLAAELSCEMPKLVLSCPIVPALATIYSIDLERTVQDLYGRDYQAFGFGPWVKN